MSKFNQIAASVAMALVAGTSAVAAPVITQNTSALALANAIGGGGITILNATFQGGAQQAGTFSNGTSSVGFNSGVVMTTGFVSTVSSSNANAAIETTGSQDLQIGKISNSNNAVGYAPLTAQGGAQSSDAAVLSIDFQFGNGTIGGNVFVNYVFTSEEYLAYVNSVYNDAFAFFLDGVNIAVVPNSSLPVTVNNINPTFNGLFYVNNVPNTNGYPVAGRDFAFDGLTTVLTASASNLSAGTHNMTFAIADIFDSFYDSAVFIQANSFANAPISNVPEPGSLALAGAGLAAAAALRKRKNVCASVQGDIA